MRIFIITMDDPIITNKFIKNVVKYKKSTVVGVCISPGGRLKLYNKSKIEYLFCLFWILGPVRFIENTFKTLSFKLDKFFCRFIGTKSSLSIETFFDRLDVPIFKTKNPNSKDFLRTLESFKPDIIINQSQHILKSELISIPKLGVLNRHNSLLPRHKGRITPFWVLYNQDPETGVSIHFVNDEIDKGDILYQFKYDVKNYNFNNLVDINYRVAPYAMLKALDLLENRDYEKHLIPNREGNYNSTPVFADLVRYLTTIHG